MDVDASDASLKRKREDVSAKLQARKHTRERVVKCGLASRLRCSALRPLIDSLVESVSRATHKGSLVFNRTLLDCLERGADLPPLQGQKAQNTYIHCFVASSEARAELTPQVRETWERHFAPLGWETTRMAGDSNALTSAAATFRTAFSNSCVFPFTGRLKAHVYAWLRREGRPFGEVWPIVNAIKGKPSKTDFSTDAATQAFVQAERGVLGLDPDVECNKTWREEHVAHVVRYYYHILKVKEADDAALQIQAQLPEQSTSTRTDAEVEEELPWYARGDARRGFSLAPICKIKSSATLCRSTRACSKRF